MSGLTPYLSSLDMAVTSRRPQDLENPPLVDSGYTARSHNLPPYAIDARLIARDRVCESRIRHLESGLFRANPIASEAPLTSLKQVSWSPSFLLEVPLSLLRRLGRSFGTSLGRQGRPPTGSSNPSRIRHIDALDFDFCLLDSPHNIIGIDIPIRTQTSPRSRTPPSSNGRGSLLIDKHVPRPRACIWWAAKARGIRGILRIQDCDAAYRSFSVTCDTR
ncbi:hypothetical protein R3P38DRAFT_3241061 [Favolaschia claudopus]|uniref:Uncharacterized protein n=1 Tax=Favolaschia claudopus TaxID=2862362 RepID=A0AAV9Z612_9AGAR